MPTKKKYNARFPPARIKKIMQTDEDIGKVAAPVPVILSKALEIFMQSLLETACRNTQARHAKTMSTAHLKQCITSESQFDFLKELVENIPDLPTNEDEADEIDEPKPKRKRASAGTSKEKVSRKERRKKEKDFESESEEESQSEEEEGSNSTESSSNTGIPSNRLSDASNSSPSFAKPSNTKRNDHFIPPKGLLQPSSSASTSASSSLQLPNASVPVPSLYRPVHSEDDDYDS